MASLAPIWTVPDPASATFLPGGATPAPLAGLPSIAPTAIPINAQHISSTAPSLALDRFPSAPAVLGDGNGIVPQARSMGSATNLIQGSFSHPQPGRPQHTGTYYDPELAAALAAYMPDTVVAPQAHSRAPGHHGGSWAVTTAHDSLAASTFGRAVRTGLDQHKAPAPIELPGQQLQPGQQQALSPAPMSAFSSSVLQLPVSGGSEGGGLPMASGMNRQGSAGLSGGSMAATWGQMQQLLAFGSGQIQQHGAAGSAFQGSGSSVRSQDGPTPPPRSKTPVLPGAKSAAAQRPVAPPVAPIPPFALKLDLAGWLALPPARVVPAHGFSSPYWLSDSNAPNPNQVLCHTLVSVGAYGAVYLGTLLSPIPDDSLQPPSPPRFKDVAVKLMRHQTGTSGVSLENMLRSFQVEADLLPGLSHDNIVPVYYANANPAVGPVCIIQVG